LVFFFLIFLTGRFEKSDDSIINSAKTESQSRISKISLSVNPFASSDSISLHCFSVNIELLDATKSHFFGF